MHFYIPFGIPSYIVDISPSVQETTLLSISKIPFLFTIQASNQVSYPRLVIQVWLVVEGLSLIGTLSKHVIHMLLKSCHKVSTGTETLCFCRKVVHVS